MASSLYNGCPIQTYLSLVSVCSLTAGPTCATKTAALDANCCDSLSSYAVNAESCIEHNKPACYVATSVASDIITNSLSNPCAAFETPGSGSGGSGGSGGSAASTPAGSPAAKTGSGTAATAGSAAGSATPTPTKSAGIKVGASLQAYIGAALVGSLLVINLM